MTLQARNLFDGIPLAHQEELFQTLAESDTIRIERIVSDGHATPPGEWYNQERDEWVLLISGEAALKFKDDDAVLYLKPGDHVMIPANCRHRVERTDTDRKTIWIAVHFCGS